MRRRAAVRDCRALDLVKEDEKILSPLAGKKEILAKNTAQIPPLVVRTREKARTESATMVEQSLDPTTLTMKALIAVRRAWDTYIVYPGTPGASTIPPVHTNAFRIVGVLQRMWSANLLVFCFSN